MSAAAPAAIRLAELAEVDIVYSSIPEFAVSDADRVELGRRLGYPGALSLVAEVDGKPAGFKVGYDRFNDGSWYSWLGGVLPEHRRGGVARALLLEQETRIKVNGYERIYVKTRNRCVGMRVLLAREGYQVVSVDATHGLADARLMHVKELS